MTTLLVTLHQGGGVVEFQPPRDGSIRWEIIDQALQIQARNHNHHDYQVRRVFAHGVWADLEVVP